jgi:hypothetical protein
MVLCALCLGMVGMGSREKLFDRDLPLKVLLQ